MVQRRQGEISQRRSGRLFGIGTLSTMAEVVNS